MARISMHIEADNFDDLISVFGNLTAARGAPAGAEGDTSKKPPRAGRRSSDGSGQQATSEAASAPTAVASPLDPDLALPPAADAKADAMTVDAFIDKVKGLLGKGKDDAVRAKLKEQGYERVRDVPPEKFDVVLTQLAKV